MEKKNWKKIIIPTICGLTLLLSGGVFAYQKQNNFTKEQSIVYADSQVVTITNKQLDKAIRKLLGKASADTLYSNDFLNNQYYKTTMSDEAVPQPTAKLRNLNLSNTGVTDITELCQFEFPETLQAINLSGNGITNNDLTNITNFLSYTPDVPVVYGEKTLTVRSDFGERIKKVNLNFNNIELNNTNSTYLDNTKLLFGIQNINEIDSSGLAPLETLTNAKYYIRENDSLYLSYNFFYEFSTEQHERYIFKNDIISPIIENANNLGHYTFNITALPSTNSSYFYEYDKVENKPTELTEKVEFTCFNAYVDSDFKIERKEPLILDGHIHVDVNPTHTTGNEITYSYNGGDGTYTISTLEHPTHTNLTITYNGKQFVYPLEYTVVDTIKPVIKLSKSKIFASKNKQIDYLPYVSAYDPNPARDKDNKLIASTSGEALPTPIEIANTYNPSQIGQYIVSFQITDNAGNASEIKTLVIEVQERVLDEIIITSNTEEYYCDSDITLVVQPDSDIPIGSYKNFLYDWYLDGHHFQSTTGDSITGRSTTTLQIQDAGNHEIKVVLTAKFKDAQEEEIQTIATFNITTELNLNSNKATILAAVIAIIIIIGIMATISLIKHRKKSNSTHKRTTKLNSTKNAKTNSSNNHNDGIQVIKNYTGNDDKGGASHLPSNDNKDTPDK